MRCGNTFAHWDDIKNHLFWKLLVCGRDYCPTCGATKRLGFKRIYSDAHKRRTARAAEVLMPLPVLGRVIFTLPKEISLSLPGKEIVESLYRSAWDIVRRQFHTPGAKSRVHFAGDRKPGLHIHFNFLFPVSHRRGRVSKERLRRVRVAWAGAVNNLLGTNYEKLNFEYSLTTVPGKKAHRIAYQYRPVVTPKNFMLLSNNEKFYYLGFRGWHNSRSWGVLSDSKVGGYMRRKKVEPLETKEVLFEKGICPICREKLIYRGIVLRDELPVETLKAGHIVNGWYGGYEERKALKNKGDP